MTAQTNLFTPAVDYKGKALEALAGLTLKEARKHLRTAKEIDPGLADLDTLAKVVDFLLDLGISSRTRAAGLARAWQRVSDARDNLSLPQHSILETTLCRRIVELLPPAYDDYVEPASGTLHIGYCFLVLNRVEEAYDKLLNYLTGRPEESHPRLWGYFGEAAYQLKRREQSNAGYVRALFMAPQLVDLAALKQPQLLRIYRDLREHHESEAARALLPAESWLQSVLHIPGGNTYLAGFIQRQRFDHSSELLLYPAQRYHQFALCLYIDQSGLHGDIDFDARTEMQRLDKELFGRYLAAIEARGRAQP